MKTFLFAAWISAFAADAETTRQAMRRGGQELNPLLTQHANVNAAVILGAGVGSAVVMHRFYDRHPTAAKRLTLLMVALHGGVALHNLRQHK